MTASAGKIHYPALLENLDFAEKAMEIQKGLLCSDDFLIHKKTGDCRLFRNGAGCSTANGIF